MSTQALPQTDPKHYVPAEDVPHQRTFMQWPNARAIYTDKRFLQDTQRTIAQIAAAISEFEPVVMLAPKAQHRQARGLLPAGVVLWDIATEDLWCRDSGPLFARRNGQLAVVDLNFNGWGNKQPHKQDAQIAKRVAEKLGLEHIDSHVVGEAGGVEQDGHGLLLAHTSSWVNKNRNDLSPQQIQTRLLAAYGAKQMIWAPGLVNEDITDFHIDSLARFYGPGRVLLQVPLEADGIWHEAGQKTANALSAAQTPSGSALTITHLPSPRRPRIRDKDFLASYANYYVCNNAVIASEFGDYDTDNQARRLLSEAYPGRDVIMLNTDTLGQLGGGIHCATREMPTVG